MRAFKKLSSTRQIGMGIGPIPVDVIWDWEDRQGVTDPVMRDFLETVLMMVDAKVCARLKAQAEANRPPPKKARR